MNSDHEISWGTMHTLDPIYFELCHAPLLDPTTTFELTPDLYSVHKNEMRYTTLMHTKKEYSEPEQPMHAVLAAEVIAGTLWIS